MKINLEIKKIIPIFVSRKTREIMEKKITDIIEKNYKGTRVGYIHCGKYSSDYVTLIVLGLRHRNMPYAAKRILEAFPEVKWVHFTGGFVEYVYSRETLKWAGIKVAV